MDEGMDKRDRERFREALRFAVASALRALMEIKHLTEMDASGKSGLSRNTVRNLTNLTGENASWPRLDTIADFLYGVQVPPAQFTSLLTKQLNGVTLSEDGTRYGKILIDIEGRVLVGRLIMVQQDEKHQSSEQ